MTCFPVQRSSARGLREGQHNGLCEVRSQAGKRDVVGQQKERKPFQTSAHTISSSFCLKLLLPPALLRAHVF